MGKSKSHCINYNSCTSIDNSILMLFWFFVGLAIVLALTILYVGFIEK